MKMNKMYVIGLFIALIVSRQYAAAQPLISYPIPAQSLTRGLDTSILTVDIGFPNACTGINVAIGMPQGITYIPGSVVATGGTGGLSITHTGGTAQRPEFSISNAPLGSNIVFTIKRIANCGSGSSGKDSVFVTSSCGNTNEISGNVNSYNIFSPSLTISPPSLINNANIGSSYSRSFSVTNGGNGCLDTLRLAVKRPSGSVASAVITLGASTIAPYTTNGDTSFYKIYGSDLPGGDNLICNGESISFSENFTLANCSGLTTTYITEWGRPGGSCQLVAATGNINIAAGVPNLTTAFSAPPMTNCGVAPRSITLAITNTGTTPASGINITIGNGSTSFISSFAYYLDTASVMVTAPGLGTYHPSGLNIAGRVLIAYANNGVPLCAGGRVAEFDFNLPTGYTLAAGQSMTVTLNVQTCSGGQCDDNSDGGILSAGLTYKDQCGGNNYALARGNVNIVPGATTKINTNIAQFPAQVASGACFNYKVDMQVFKSSLPATPNGYIEYAVTLPAGITFNSATETGSGLPAQAGYPMMIGNKAVFRHNIIHQSSGQSTHTVTFNLCVNPGACGSLPILSEVSLVRDSTCANPVVNKKCASGTVEVYCGGACSTGGVVPTAWSYHRTTYGLPDNDNDGVPDAGGTIDFSQIDRDRYRPGDILHSEYRSYVQNQTSPSIINNWNYVYSEWTFGNGKFAPSGTATVTIKRGATTYTLTSVAISTIIAGTAFKADWSAHPNLPGGFTYQLGDSVIVEADFMVDGIYNPGGGGTQVYAMGPGYTSDAPAIIQLSQTVYASQTANPAAGANNGPDRFTCFVPRYNLNVVGLQHFVSYDQINATGATGCSNFDIGASTYTRILASYQTGRYFINEYRPEVFPDTIMLDIPAGWDYISTTSTNLYRVNAPSAFSIEALNITPIVSNYMGGTRLTYDFRTLLQNGTIPHWGTDGMWLLMNNGLRANCSTPATATVRITEKAHWNDYTSAANPASFTITAIQALNYNASNRPAIAIQDNTGTIQGILPQHYWDIQLNSTGSNAAPYVWMALEQGNTGISIDSVVLKPSNVALSPLMYSGTKKWYQVNTGGIASGSNQQARVYFKYNNCSIDSIKMLAGWNCSSYPFPDPSTGTCSQTYTYLKVQPQPSQVQLAVSRQPTQPSVGLCTIDTVEAIVNSALGANVDNPQVTVIPPAGLNLNLPLQIEYPLGSGNWQNVTAVLNAGNYVVNLEQHTGIGTNGIPGTISNPAAAGRQVNIRASYSTNCDFVSGSRIGFITNGQNSCNNAAIGNGDYVSSSQINITGASSNGSAGMLIDVSPPELTCGIVKTIPFNVTPVAFPSQPGDSAVYVIPSGIGYVSGSFAPGNNCTGCTVVQSSGTGGSTVLKVALPNGVPPGAAIEYTMDMRASSTGNCGNSVITAEVQRQIGGVNCGATVCPSGKIVIGSASQTVLVKKPQLNVTNLSLTMAGNIATYSATITNSGTENAAGGFPVHLLCGGANGSLLHSFNTTAIGTGSSQTFTGSFIWTPSASCPAGSLLFAKVSDTMANGDPVCMCTTPAGTVSTTPLPVELISFTSSGSACKTTLNWETGKEENLLRFDIQQSTDGMQYTSVASQTSKGNNSTYSVVIPLKDDNINHFRLLAVDRDGATSYSHSITAKGNCDRTITVLPNPAKDKITVIGAPKNAHLRLINALGQVTLDIVSVDNSQDIDISRLSKGVYTLQVISENATIINLKVIKI
jgi:hypothetical protein